MGAFVNSVKQIISSVFGRGDIVHLLRDDFEIDPSMNPDAAPGALHAREKEKEKEKEKGKPKQKPKQRHRQPPPSNLSPNAVAQRLAKDTFGGPSSLDIPDVEDFDWSGEFDAEDEDDRSLAPVALDALLDGGPGAASGEGDVLRLLRHAAPSDGDSPLAMAGTVIDSGVVPPTMATGEVLGAAREMLDEDRRRAAWQPVGPPPSTLWDESEIKLELLDQLETERLMPPPDVDPANWTLAVDRLGLALGQLERELPPLPVAAGTLLGVGGDLPTDEQVIDAIKADPILAGSVVKAANSPFYMAAVPAASLQGALMRLGVDEARRVAIATAFEGTFEIAGNEDLVHRMREHALGTAISCEILARTARGVDSGHAFLAGLLHDAGELLVHRMLEQGAQDERLNPEVVERLARRVHPRTGALLFGGWDLDAGIAAALAFHHAPDEVEERFSPLCHVVHVGDLVAHIAVGHRATAVWRDALTFYADRDDPGSRERAVAQDGIDDLDVDVILAVVPRGFGRDRVRGVIRGVLLRMESDGIS